MNLPLFKWHVAWIRFFTDTMESRLNRSCPRSSREAIVKHVSKAMLPLESGDEVKVSVRGRKIIIEPARKVRSRFDLKELLAKMPKHYRGTEIDWGAPAGKEEW